MKVFITGVGGLLGSNLAKYLILQNHQVGGIDNMIGGVDDNIHPSVEFTEGDITDTALMKEITKGYEVIFHAAALPYEGLSVFSPAIVTESVVFGTVSVASAAIHNDVRLLINCSSMARYGNQTPPFTEDMPACPVDPYGLAKVQAEEHLQMLNDIHGLNYVTVVPHNVIGVGQRYYDPFRNVVGIMINRCLQGKPIVVYGDGEQQRSFSNVYDCVLAIYKIIESNRDICKEVYNIGPDDNEISIKQLAYKVGHYCEKYPSLEHYPDRPQEVKNAFCSSGKIRREFNYNAKITMDQTIREMVDWIRPRVKPFEYHLDLEFITDKTPKTWTDKLI
jgi:UDP-glucose 4-epimerase